MQVLIDAVVHAVNEDYREMAGDFIKLGFLAPGALFSVWGVYRYQGDWLCRYPEKAPRQARTVQCSSVEKACRDLHGQALADFNFRTVTSRFNELVY